MYGMSDSSVRRYVNMFLDTINFNNDCFKMQVQLPNSTDHIALHDLATAWSAILTAYGILNYNIWAING